MKTTKKGFTLIELIVVIAIIGVLAAILVPAMIGYVRQAKIRTADEAATSIKNGINAGLTDLMGAGKDVSNLSGSWKDLSGLQTAAAAPGTLSQATEDDLKPYVKEYFDEIDKVDGAYFIKETSCVGVVCSVDGTYWGSYPTGKITSKNYKSGAELNSDKDAAAKKTAAENLVGTFDD